MPTNAFITNAASRTLKKRLEELIQHSQELKFRVGFFYFSGWRELYESLKSRGDLTIKLLVGLDVDRVLGESVEMAKEGDSLSNDDLADRFFGSLQLALNDESLDNQQFYEQVSYFLELLESGRLQIKKTLDPNHAKLYFFKLKEELKGLLNSENNGKFITGSSNLTRAGIRGQHEFNVEIGDYGSEEAEKYFDGLWQSAVPITEIPARKDFLIRSIRNRTQVANITPFEAYALVLKTYIDLAEQKSLKLPVVQLMEKRGYKPYKYQIDAANQALTMLDEYNGVVIADVVGLGKSVIASILARDLGRRGIVLCPPSLMGDSKRRDAGWYKYTEDFKLYDWPVFSSGDLEKAALYLEEHGDDVEVVLVDEAHRFRNEDTQDYEWLSNICRNRKVVLLTATPFNNTPADIFTLLKLFIVPGKSKITLDENLEARFSVYNSNFRDLSFIARYYNSREASKRERAAKLYIKLFDGASLPVDVSRVQERAKKLAAQIRGVIEPVLIRRNRLDLKLDPVYSKEISELSDVADPVEMFYKLSSRQMAFYDKVLNEYFSEVGRFHGAIYQPYVYEEAEIDEDKLSEAGNRAYQQQRNLFEFMRRLLVKRFESSFGAFAQSIENFIYVHEVVLAFIKKSGGKYVLDRKLIESIYLYDPDDIEAALVEFARQLSELKKAPKHQHIYILSDFARQDEFLDHIKSDLELLCEIRDRIKELRLVANDPKLIALVDELKAILGKKPDKAEPRRKVVVFSEYVDTVRHLRSVLEKEFKDKIFIVEGALSANNLHDILANFDASVKPHNQRDAYQILLTSDKLSEGVNLNRAGAIINYDIPWNPTRVIQRVGRINRISKKVFKNLYIYNFFPTEQGADVVKSREIASQKMFLIHNTLGEDAKIFAVDETPSPAELFRRVNANPEEEQEESTLTTVRRLYFDIQARYPEVVERINNFPPRVKTGKAGSANQLLVFRRKGLGMYIQAVDDTAEQNMDIRAPLLEEALSAIQCDNDEPRLSLSARFWAAYEAAKEHQDIVHVPKSERALETRALNNLLTALSKFQGELEAHLPFIRTLVLDMREYKTLSKFTLRRLASAELKEGNAKSLADFKAELESVRNFLGVDYLDIIRERLGSLKSEVIIAIENQRAAYRDLVRTPETG